MPIVDFVYFDAGGGHRAAANALKEAVEKQQRPWTVRLVNLQEILDSLDVFKKVTGIRLEDIYNQLLAKGWTLGSAQMLKFMHLVIRRYHAPTVKLLERHWRETKPDLVVSLVPNFNRAMHQSLAAANPKTPYVTILTDFADFPPNFWIERQEQYLICGTDRAVQQAISMGHARERVFRTSGMILRPKFYEPVDVDPAAERQKLGLDPKRATGLVLFGGQGSPVMIDIAKRLSDIPVQLIMICGRNEKLARRLRELPKVPTMHVEGFTAEIPYFMRISDFLIGKPGPGSLAEAMAMKLPVIVERNSFTLPQERYNADWVRDQGVGRVLASFRNIEQGVRDMLAPGVLARHRAKAAAMDNQAVWEIPGILEGLIQ